MSAAILSAISHLPQLRGSLRHTAQRLAYFAGINGRVQKSYSFLATDLHVSESTPLRHIARLCAEGIISKEVRWLASKQCAINVYTFLVGVPLDLHKCDPGRLPVEQAKREKSPHARKEKPTNDGLAWLRTANLTAESDFLRACRGEEARL
jgi:hypothetical protein